jgi:hypothetical protein
VFSKGGFLGYLQRIRPRCAAIGLPAKAAQAILEEIL